MTSWTTDELASFGRSDELGIASRRTDGTLRPFITIWFVSLGDDLYVRSAHGYDNPWFQRALAAGQGRVRVAGVERDVSFEVPDAAVTEDLHAAYHAKYGRYAMGIVNTVVSPEAARSTLRVSPR